MILLNSASSNRHRNLADFPTDSDASAYFSAVEAAGSTIGVTARKAVNNFIIGLKADGLWSLIHELYLYAGPDTLAGALVKVKGSGTRVNNGFVSGDFSPTLGLQGDGTSKYIANNFLASSFASLSNSIFVYSSSGFNSSGNKTLSGNYPSNLVYPGDRNGLISLDAYAAYVSARAFRSGTYDNGKFPVSYALITSGSIFGSRTSATMAKLYQNGLPVASSTSSISPSFASQDIFSFGFSNNGVLNSGSVTADRRQVEAFAQGLDDNQAAILHKRTATYVENLLGFSPLSLNPALWLDASDASTLYDATSGGSLVNPDGAIARWEDKSGGGRHAIESTSTKRPLRKSGIQLGKDIARFDGVDDLLQNSTFPGGINNCSIFAVMKWTSGGTTPDLPIFIGTSDNYYSGRSIYRVSGGTTLGFATWGNDVSSSSVGLDIGGSFHLFSAIQSGTSVALRRDGTGGNYTLPSMPSATVAGFYIGGFLNPGGGEYWSATDIGEIVIYPTALSDSDRALVEAYLTAKWLT